MKNSQKLIRILHKKILLEKKKRNLMAYKLYMMLDHSTPKYVKVRRGQKEKQLKKQLKTLLKTELTVLEETFSNFQIS